MSREHALEFNANDHVDSKKVRVTLNRKQHLAHVKLGDYFDANAGFYSDSKPNVVNFQNHLLQEKKLKMEGV